MSCGSNRGGRTGRAEKTATNGERDSPHSRIAHEITNRKRIDVKQGVVRRILTGVFAALAGTFVGPAWALSLPAAPPELAAFGYARGALVLDDETATLYVAGYATYQGAPEQAAIVALHKGGSDAAFVASERANANGGPGRRIAAAETERFNRVVAPALARIRPDLARTTMLYHFIYAKGRHFEPSADYRDRQQRTRTPYEQPFLTLLWVRDSLDSPFSPHKGLLAATPVAGFPVTLAEATRERAARAIEQPAPQRVAAARESPASGTNGATPHGDLNDPYVLARLSRYCWGLEVEVLGSTDEARQWSQLMDRGISWSVLYQHSLRDLHRETINPPSDFGKCWVELPRVLRESDAGLQVWKQEWKTARAHPPTPPRHTAPEDALYDALWCEATAQAFDGLLVSDPGVVDRGHPEAIPMYRENSANRLLFWSRRVTALAGSKGNAKTQAEESVKSDVAFYKSSLERSNPRAAWRNFLVSEIGHCDHAQWSQ